MNPCSSFATLVDFSTSKPKLFIHPLPTLLLVIEMEEVLIVKRLERVDRELHSVIDELRFGKHRTLPLSELNKYMEKDRISDVDSTKLIREMRDREYDL